MKKYLETATEDFARYWRKYFRTEAMAWLNVVRYYGIVIPIVVIALIAAVIHSSPLPPGSATLAVGQAGSSYGDISDELRSIFKRHDIDLRLEETTGLEQGLKKLNDARSDVDAAYYLAGSSDAAGYPNLMSLGALQYTPIWLFYRGETVEANDPFQYFADKLMAIGLRETATYRIFHELYDLDRNDARDGARTFLELPHAQAADMLLAGKLDAMVLVDNLQSPTVQRLLGDPDIKVMDFRLAQAYTRKLPYLETLTIPMGSFNIATVKPEKDVRILATYTVLLVEKTMHPAIQWAFLLAAREISSTRTTFFSRPGYFPRNLASSFPLSPVAQRYYENGVPQLFRYMPLWMASIVDNVWVLVLAFFALILPLFRFITGVRTYPSKKGMYDLFYDLRDIDEQAVTASTTKELEALLVRLDYYEGLNHDTWLAPLDVRFYFTIKSQIGNLRRDIRAKLEKFPKSS